MKVQKLWPSRKAQVTPTLFGRLALTGWWEIAVIRSLAGRNTLEESELRGSRSKVGGPRALLRAQSTLVRVASYMFQGPWFTQRVSSSEVKGSRIVDLRPSE